MTESLADDEAAYAYVRMKLGNDEYSERVKFAFVVWAGEYFFFHSIPRNTVTKIESELRSAHVW
jgi:hypothetical protein